MDDTRYFPLRDFPLPERDRFSTLLLIFFFWLSTHRRLEKSFVEGCFPTTQPVRHSTSTQLADFCRSHRNYRLLVPTRQPHGQSWGHGFAPPDMSSWLPGSAFLHKTRSSRTLSSSGDVCHSLSKTPFTVCRHHPNLTSITLTGTRSYTRHLV